MDLKSIVVNINVIEKLKLLSGFLNEGTRVSDLMYSGATIRIQEFSTEEMSKIGTQACFHVFWSILNKNEQPVQDCFPLILPETATIYDMKLYIKDRLKKIGEIKVEGNTVKVDPDLCQLYIFRFDDPDLRQNAYLYEIPLRKPSNRILFGDKIAKDESTEGIEPTEIIYELWHIDEYHEHDSIMKIVMNDIMNLNITNIGIMVNSKPPKSSTKKLCIDEE